MPEIDPYVKKNALLSMATGCLRGLHDVTPGPDHQKVKRVTRQTHDLIIRSSRGKIPKCKPYQHVKLVNYIEACNIILTDIKKEKNSAAAVLLNLSAYCVEQIPMAPYNRKKFYKIFDLFPAGTWKPKNNQFGEEMFEHIEEEYNQLELKRLGIAAMDTAI